MKDLMRLKEKEATRKREHEETKSGKRTAKLYEEDLRKITAEYGEGRRGDDSLRFTLARNEKFQWGHTTFTAPKLSRSHQLKIKKYDGNMFFTSLRKN